MCEVQADPEVVLRVLCVLQLSPLEVDKHHRQQVPGSPNHNLQINVADPIRIQDLSSWDKDQLHFLPGSELVQGLYPIISS